MKSNVVFDKMYFVFKSNIGFIDNDILDDEIKCLTFQAWEGRGGGEEKEAGEEEDLSRGQGSQLYSMSKECQFVCQYETKVHNLAKNLLSHTVWVTPTIRDKEQITTWYQPTNIVDDGNYQVKQDRKVVEDLKAY